MQIYKIVCAILLVFLLVFRVVKPFHCYPLTSVFIEDYMSN